MVRSTLIHELGHAFGMRHNFMGSIARSEKPEAAPLATNPYSDSIMDYNNYTVDLFQGAMKDYTDANSAVTIPDMGMYDVLQLASAYKLDASQFQVKVGPAFCTDRNIGNDNNCQQYDLGKDFKEFMVFDTNRALQKLRWTSVIDNILEPQFPVISSLIGRISNNSYRMGDSFVAYQNLAIENSEMVARDEGIRVANLMFNALGDTQGLFAAYEKQYGSKVLGLRKLITFPDSFFADPAYGAILGGIIREAASVAIVSGAEAYKGSVPAGSDAAYLGTIHNMTDANPETKFKNILIDLFASLVMIPKGTDLNLKVFNGTVSNNSATLNGVPLTQTLKQPLFNHSKNVVIVPSVSVDDVMNPGQVVQLPAAISGSQSIETLIFNAVMTAYVSGGGKSSDSAARLRADMNALKSQLKSNACKSSEKSEVCVKVADGAKQAAEIMVREYEKVIAFSENSQNFN
jgi:hypothetical protein